MILTAAGKDHISQIKRIYKNAFPRNERKPFWLIRKKERQGLAEILAVFDDDFAGLVITLLHADMVLVDYFAIDGSKRGKGLGSCALRLICERYAGKRIVLEIESPDACAPEGDERVRRKNFYLKNGFTDIKIPVSVFGVSMELLTYRCEMTFSEYQSILIHVMGRYSKKFFTRKK